jgi:phosphatidylinositol glycan class F
MGKRGTLSIYAKRLMLLNISNVIVICVLTIFGSYAFDYLNIVTHSHVVIELLCIYLLVAHLLISFTDTESSYKSKSLRLQVWKFLRAVTQLVLSACLIHIVLILFGAPFTQSVSETFHLACLITSTSVLPCMSIIGTSTVDWFSALSTHGHETLPERTVVISSVASVVGSWLGAFPIPLDWDRPWQAWPVTCVIGSLTCYCVAVISCSLFLVGQLRVANKSKGV